jgi:hypothetical protein
MKSNAEIEDANSRCRHCGSDQTEEMDLGYDLNADIYCFACGERSVFMRECSKWHLGWGAWLWFSKAWRLPT